MGFFPKPREDDFAAGVMDSLSKISHRKSSSDELSTRRNRRSHFARSVSASEMTFDLSSERIPQEKQPYVPAEKRTLKKKRKDKEDGKPKRRLSKELSEELVNPANRQLNITIETKSVSPVPNLETITVSPLWGSSLKSLSKLKEGDDLSSLKGEGVGPDVTTSIAALNPLAMHSLAKSESLTIPRDHRASSSKEIQPATISEPKAVQRLQSGNLIRINENGQEVAVIEIAGKSNILSAATPEKLIERMVCDEEQDVDFVRSVIVTYCQFLTTQSFLERLISMYYIAPGKNSTSEHLAYFQKMQPMVQQRWSFVVALIFQDRRSHSQFSAGCSL